MKPGISVLILTRDEENNLPGCLESVRPWANELIVLDSGSTDDTPAIARDYGCRVFSRPFDNWSSHQNWAVTNLPFEYEWVLNIDADERVSPELAAEIRAAVAAPSGNAAFRMRRKDYFRGVWLKHATFYPTWLIRLYRPRQVAFERLVNPVTTVAGPVGTLAAHIEHWPFSKGVAHWIDRHNSYSSFESLEYRGRPAARLSALLARDPNRRRAALKSLFAHLPGKPAIKFFYLYLLHRGFLDGRAGLDYCLLQSIYEYFITLKVRERE